MDKRLAAGDPRQLTWPLSKIGEALQALAKESRLHFRPTDPGNEVRCEEERIVESAATLGLEAESVELMYGELEHHLRSIGPALLLMKSEEQPRLLLLLRGLNKVSVLGPDLRVRKLPVRLVHDWLCRDIETPLLPELNQLLRYAAIPQRLQARVRQAVLRERLSGESIGGCWLIRLPPGAGFWDQMRQAHLPSRLARLATAHAVQFLLWILAWWVVGNGALQGRLDRGWLIAWILILLTLIPFRLAITWLEGVFAIGAGALLKQRLLFGALQLEPEHIRCQGAGQLLGRVIESEAVESLALSGGLLAVVSLIELVMSAGVLYAGAGGWLHVLLLLAWVGVALVISWRYWRCYGRWTESRLEMTNDLVERMVGHRTRLAQQVPEQWHEGEDHALNQYLGLSGELDRVAVLQEAFVPRGWLIVGILGIAPAFTSVSSSSATLAVAIGGVLLAQGALARFSQGLQHLIGAFVSWQQVVPLYHAAGLVRDEAAVSRAALATNSRAERNRILLEAQQLSFCYPQRTEPAIHHCDLRIAHGDRIILEGSSGSGKSTLASLLTGLRTPRSGLLLLDGLDRQTLGTDGWRRRVSAAPQFHENYVLTGTFSFNLLMGRRWPAELEDLQEAESICSQLGLDDLLKRMPSGLLQIVGETGWQLSHGERSRLFIARALLQGSDLIVLDESFASLDSENLRRALSCVLQRARTLLVVAHP